MFIHYRDPGRQFRHGGRRQGPRRAAGFAGAPSNVAKHPAIPVLCCTATNIKKEDG
jgi:hypothetical protein